MTADLAPLPRRLLGVAALLALLLVAVAVNGALHGGEGGGTGADGDVAAAVARTQQTGGGRITMVATYSSPGSERTIRARGHGVYNERTNRSRVAIEIRSGLGSTRLVAVGDGSFVFVRSAEISRELPGRRTWLGTQQWMGGRSDTAAIGGNGGAQGLEMLEAIGGETESVGEATVRGVSAERFRGTITMAAYAAALRAAGKRKEARVYGEVAEQVTEPLTVEAWVWPDGLVRRLRTKMTIDGAAGGRGLTMDMVVDLHDLGIAPKIPLPRAGKVFDTTPITRAELDLIDGTASLPRTPSGGPALSAATLRDRANGICALMSREAEGLLDSEALKQLEGLGPDSDLADAEAAFRAYGNQVLLPIVRIADRALGQLAELTPPPRLRTTYRRFLRTWSASDEAYEALGRALQLGKIGTVEKVEATADRISEENDELARQLGLHACAGPKDGGSGTGGDSSLS
ncbi:MAG: hypothetical protein R2725_14105 [Solirubrobacterales bacterium]